MQPCIRSHVRVCSTVTGSEDGSYFYMQCADRCGCVLTCFGRKRNVSPEAGGSMLNRKNINLPGWKERYLQRCSSPPQSLLFIPCVCATVLQSLKWAMPGGLFCFPLLPLTDPWALCCHQIKEWLHFNHFFLYSLPLANIAMPGSPVCANGVTQGLG